jgi:hypothetical protein
VHRPLVWLTASLPKVLADTVELCTRSLSISKHCNFSADLLLPRLFPEVIETLRKADAVCFDVDSTVCLDEGIDELANFCGAGQAVAEWTAK